MAVVHLAAFSQQFAMTAADAIFAKSTVCCNRAFKKQKLLVIYFIFVGRFGKNLIEANEWFERKIEIALWTRQLNGKWHFH